MFELGEHEKSDEDADFSAIKGPHLGIKLTFVLYVPGCFVVELKWHSCLEDILTITITDLNKVTGKV